MFEVHSPGLTGILSIQVYTGGRYICTSYQPEGESKDPLDINMKTKRSICLRPERCMLIGGGTQVLYASNANRLSIALSSVHSKGEPDTSHDQH